MSEAVVEPRDRATTLVHYYRAMVGRADIWRMRMDATTNWAIGATSAIATFALGSREAPHFAILLAPLLTLSFLLLEARRLTFYHLWQQRVLLLEREWIRPTLVPGATPGALAEELAPQLGRTVPTMSLWKAAARRLRRISLYLFAVQLAAWALKLASLPTSTDRADVWIERARIGSFTGEMVLGVAAVLFLALLGLGLGIGGVDRRRE